MARQSSPSPVVESPASEVIAPAVAPSIALRSAMRDARQAESTIRKANAKWAKQSIASALSSTARPACPDDDAPRLVIAQARNTVEALPDGTRAGSGTSTIYKADAIRYLNNPETHAELGKRIDRACA
jgi:hypothetical protein